jgi:hypothetical protein
MLATDFSTVFVERVPDEATRLRLPRRRPTRRPDARGEADPAAYLALQLSRVRQEG